MSIFKEFTMRGNVVDMAFGIIIRSAFGKIVTSLVNDIIMPPIGLLLGGIDFNGFAVALKGASGDVAAVAIQCGTLVNVALDFVLVAFVLFMVIKLINSLKARKDAAPTTMPKALQPGGTPCGNPRSLEEELTSAGLGPGHEKVFDSVGPCAQSGACRNKAALRLHDRILLEAG